MVYRFQMAGNQNATTATNTLTGMAEPNVIAKLKPKIKMTAMEAGTKTLLSTGVMLFLCAVLIATGSIITGTPETEQNAPSTAVAWVKIIDPINDVVAVAQIYEMQPHRLATSGGEGYITRGNEIYIKAPDTLSNSMRLSPNSFGASRCVQITAAKYGWRVLNVYTRRECKKLHYD